MSVSARQLDRPGVDGRCIFGLAVALAIVAPFWAAVAYVVWRLA